MMKAVGAMKLRHQRISDGGIQEETFNLWGQQGALEGSVNVKSVYTRFQFDAARGITIDGVTVDVHPEPYSTQMYVAGTTADVAGTPLQGAAGPGLGASTTAELVEAAVAAALKASTTSKPQRPKLPSALSDISQTAWRYVQHDFGLEMVYLPPADLGGVAAAPPISAYQWQGTQEDDQKDAYMAYIRTTIPLDERTEWIQGDKYGALLNADQVHMWPEGEAQPYHLSGTPDAVAVLTAYKDGGVPWDGIRLTVEVKKTIKEKWHCEAAAQLICANITSSKFKPVAMLTDLVNEWHLKYMSGHKLYGSKFPSREAAVAFIKGWLQKESVVESAESEEPLAIAEPSEGGLGPLLKRARYSYRFSGEAPGDDARLADLADCLPREEACEVLCLAGLRDLMHHYRPLISAPLSMYS